jgi:hypothetical protein
VSRLCRRERAKLFLNGARTSSRVVTPPVRCDIDRSINEQHIVELNSM